MIPEPVILIVIALIIVWAFFGAGHASIGQGRRGQRP